MSGPSSIGGTISTWFSPHCPRQCVRDCRITCAGSARQRKTGVDRVVTTPCGGGAPRKPSWQEANVDLHLVSPDPRYSKVRLIEPAALGYVHVAAEVRAPKRTGPVLLSRERSQLVCALQVLGRQLEGVPGGQKVSGYEAMAFGLPSAYVRQRATLIHPARFDVVVLAETDSPDVTRDVRGSIEYQALVDHLTARSRHVHAIAARNIKRVGDVDKSRPGIFLFNYFVG